VFSSLLTVAPAYLESDRWLIGYIERPNTQLIHVGMKKTKVILAVLSLSENLIVFDAWKPFFALRIANANQLGLTHKKYLEIIGSI
jgi:hypothetical protein